MAPLKLAIVGGGPSAFYIASRLLRLVPSTGLRIHVYDRLWAPHGLVRYGVAPDHPEVKNCIHKFDETALDPRFRFFGNINIDISSAPCPIPNAATVPLDSLFLHYSHLIFASGCTVSKLHPSLPLSSICRSALDIVHWYTQHPGRSSLYPPSATMSHVLSPPPPLDKIEHVSIIGHGNVSLDAARMLLTPVEHLKAYDVPTGVLNVLSASRVKHVSIIGRRGPREASFTTKELREMMHLPNAAMKPLHREALAEITDLSSATNVRAGNEKNGGPLTRQQVRLLDLIAKGSMNNFGTTHRSWSLDFFRAPASLDVISSPSGHGKARLVLKHTALDADRRAQDTGATSDIETDMIIQSLGYEAECGTGAWIDATRGHIRNIGGRVLDEGGRIMRNVYAGGWAATGAHGVLASTMLNAFALVDTLLSDYHAANGDAGRAVLQTGLSPARPVENGVIELLNTCAVPESLPQEVIDALNQGLVMNYTDWKRVDEEEIRRGAEKGKERERMDWKSARAFLSSH